MNDAEKTEFILGKLSDIEDDPFLEGQLPSTESRSSWEDLEASFGDTINNVAYHDYYRIEIATPQLTTTHFDVMVLPKLEGLVGSMANLAVANVNAAYKVFANIGSLAVGMPDESTQIDQWLTEIYQELDAMSAGPVPETVSRFVSVALGDYIDSATWSALAPSDRQRLAQLAAAWTELNRPRAPSTSGSSKEPSEGLLGGGIPSPQDVLSDPLGVLTGGLF